MLSARSLLRFALTLALSPSVAFAASAASNAEIVKETTRTRQEGRRVLNFWWLPTEYFEAVARDLGKGEDEIENVRRNVRGYLVLGVLDARAVPGGKFEMREHGELVKRMRVARNGDQMTPLRQISPALTERMPELTYFLTAGLGPLASGVRLFFFSNLDAAGKPILSGSRDGSVSLTYRLSETADPIELRWHAPLTAIAGHKTCPTGGEDLQAHWAFCPWHGIPATPPE